MRHSWRWLTLLTCLLTGTAVAADAPGWSLEVKGGKLESAMEEWAEFYDDERIPQFSIGFAYKLLRQLEIGAEAGYLRDKGAGFAPGHGTVAGSVKYELLPLHLTATLRGVFYEDQWLVPYVGAAVGRYSYRVRVDAQPKITGHVNGTLYRAGLQLLLDRLDRRAAAAFHRDFGVANTYLFVEYQDTEAELDENDLGGKAWLGGLLLEF